MHAYHGTKGHLIVRVMTADYEYHQVGVKQAMFGQICSYVVGSPGASGYVEHPYGPSKAIAQAPFQQRAGQAILIGLVAPVDHRIADQ